MTDAAGTGDARIAVGPIAPQAVAEMRHVDHMAEIKDRRFDGKPDSGIGAIFGALAIVAITVIAYLPAFWARFIWDDDVLLTGNPLVSAADGWRRAWTSTRSPDYFPLTTDSFWLEWRLWGANPAGYHVDNVLIHAAAAVLIWRVLRHLPCAKDERSKTKPGGFANLNAVALTAAILFAVHPVNVASVAWISERKNTLSLLFAALSTLFYLNFGHTRRRGWYAASLAAFVAAMLCKTSVVVLPVVLLGIVWWRRRNEQNTANGNDANLSPAERIRPDASPIGRDLLLSAPFFFFAAMLAVVTVRFQSRNVIATSVVRPEGFFSRLAAAGWAIGFYLWKDFVPVRLMMVYPRWNIDPRSPASWMADVQVLVGVVLASIHWRTWGRAALAALGYFVVALLPVLGVFDMYYFRFSLVADHWQYLAILAPIVFCTAAAGAKWPRQWAWGAAVVIVVFICLTWRQCELYRDRFTLFSANLRLNPRAWVARKSVADCYYERGDDATAIPLYEQTVAEHGDYADAWLNLGNALEDVGRFDDAAAAERRAIALAPTDARPWNTLGECYAATGQSDEAIAAFKRAAAIDPSDAGAYNNWAGVYLRQENFAQGVPLLRKALAADPTLASAQINLANALFHLGRFAEAADLYRGYLGQAARADVQPASPASGQPSPAALPAGAAKAQVRLGICLVKLGKVSEGRATLRAALASDPSSAEARSALDALDRQAP